jgi:hypothetical protein
MLYIYYESYKGGTNNLCVARDSDTGLTATSIKGKYKATELLDHKITKRVDSITYTSAEPLHRGERITPTHITPSRAANPGRKARQHNDKG